MKTKLGNVLALYPMPTVLAGTMIQEKPTCITMAHVGILTHKHIMMGMNKTHYSNQGIAENRTFSINFPTRDMVKVTDYAGIVSGKNTDKSKLFTYIYGELETAPLIEECPLNMECRVTDILDYKTHDIFIGEVVQTYAREDILTNGKIDITKIKPLLFDMATLQYFDLGEPVARCWHVGKDYQP